MAEKATDIKIGGRFWSTTVDGKIIDASQIDGIDESGIATREWIENNFTIFMSNYIQEESNTPSSEEISSIFVE